MKLRALVKNKVMLILVDSGSSHSFVSQAFLQTVGIQSSSTQAMQVRLANGEVMVTDHCVKDMEWWVEGSTLKADMKVLELGVYDAILGYDWLSALSPMVCHWKDKTLEFEENGKTIKLSGIRSKVKKVQTVSIDKVFKWSQGNDIWAIAIVEMVQPEVQDHPVKEIRELLHKFRDVFQAPKTLPPGRFYDHQVPLLPGAIPVNSKPYRYSSQHKDEIEKQVKELLAASLSNLVPVLLLVQCYWSKRRMVVRVFMLIIGS